MANEKRLILVDTKVSEYPWGYFEIQTENFFFRVYKHGGGNGRPITYRAESSVKVGERKYQVAWRHFHEWDYRDKNEAYDFAKCWVKKMARCLSAELSSIDEAIDVLSDVDSCEEDDGE